MYDESPSVEGSVERDPSPVRLDRRETRSDPSTRDTKTAGAFTRSSKWFRFARFLVH